MTSLFSRKASEYPSEVLRRIKVCIHGPKSRELLFCVGKNGYIDKVSRESVENFIEFYEEQISWARAYLKNEGKNFTDQWSPGTIPFPYGNDANED